MFAQQTRKGVNVKPGGAKTKDVKQKPADKNDTGIGEQTALH